MNNDAINKFLGVIRGEINDYDDSHDKVAECKIISANDDGTYNIALISDEKTIINNIVNGTPYSYRVGSSVYLYKVRNQIASSFLIGGTKFANALNRNTSSESSSGSGTTTVVSGTSTPTIVELKGYSGTPVVSLSVNGLVANVTVNNVASANYAARSNYAVFSGAASNYLPNGNIATALAGKQSTLTFDNAPISGSTNPVISGGIYDYAVANIGWENASLVSRKAGAATVLANQTSEQEAEASYSIVTANTQITAAATDSIPTAAAVYNFASQGKSINVNIPASGLYPLAASNTSTAGQVYLGMNVGTYINMADGSITSSAFHGNADSATTAKDYSAVGGIATQFARDNVAINNVNLSVSDATVTFTNAAGIAKSYTVNNVVNATTASQAVSYVAGGAIDLALKGKVYDVSWDSTQSNLYVYNQSWSDSPRSIASTEPQQEAQTAYSIVDDLSVQPGANSIPTALAVWNATLTASHINVSAPTQGNFSLVGVTGVSTQANLYTDSAVYFNYSTNSLWAGGIKLTGNTGTVTGVTASTNSTALVVQSNGSSTTPLITVNVASGYSIPTTGSQTNWNAAYAAAVTNKVSSIADVTNIPTAAAVYGYAVTNVAWDSSQTELQVTKAGTTTNVATVTPEQAVQTSYAVSVNIDTESAPTSAIPTVQAVKDYTPVNQGEGISVSNKTISLNVATTNTLGGIKVGYTGTTDRTYAVTLDSGNHAYVSVPWSSTTWRPINLNGTAFLTNSTSSGALGFAQGQAMALSGSSGVVTIAANTATASGFGVIKVGSSLTAPSGVLDINTAHSNTWTAPQAFNTNVTIGGNLTVTGTTTHVNVTDLNVDKALITLANGSEYARPLTVGAGLFVANCAGAGTNTNVALVFDSNGIAYVGRANLNTAGNVIVSDNPGLIPLLGRDVSSNFTTGHLLAWTSSNNKAVDAGVAVSSAVSSASTNVQLPTAKAVYDYAYAGFVSDVSWSSDGSSLNVTKGSSTASVASTTPEQAADTTYTILGTIPTSMSSETNQLPTAYAVYKFASQAGSLIVKNTDTSANYYLTLIKDASNTTTSQTVYDNSTVYVNTATNHMNIGTNTVVDSGNIGSYAVTKVTAGSGLTTTSASSTDGGSINAGTGTLYLTTVNATWATSGNSGNNFTVDRYGRVTSVSTTPYLTTQTWRGINVTNAGATTSVMGTGSAGTITFINGTDIALTAGTNSITIASTYALPLAANGTRGGIQIGYVQNGQNYPVALSSEKAYVSVPWTDHVYTGTAPVVVCASTNVISLAASGVTAGTYQGIAFDAYGRATSATAKNYVKTVAWTDTSLTALRVTQDDGTTSDIASTTPEKSADASYSIVTDIDANPSTTGLPTAAAVASYAASARHGTISITGDGTNATGTIGTATYLVNTGVGYVSGSFTAKATIARGSLGAISAATSLSSWVGASSRTYEGIGLSTNSSGNRDVSLRLVVDGNGTGILYSSAIKSGDVVQFKMYC
jgi:hypothetical protein